MRRQSDVTALGTILGVWAHPDDEAFLAGGLMALARSAGQRVVVVTATRGEQGTDDPRLWPPDLLGRRRQIELEYSLEAIGVEEHHVLGHPDGGCASVPFEVGSGQVAQLITDVQPDTILTFGPDGYTGHSDHRTMSHWVDAALRDTRADARVLHATADRGFLDRFAEVHERFDVFFAGTPSVTDRSEMSVHLELRGPILDRKVAALRAQASQTQPLITSLGERRFRSWVATESFVRAASVREQDSAVLVRA